jgi:hypothetical protein
MKLRELLQLLDKVYHDIECSKPYICGGTPRDRFMSKIDNISDIDICNGDKSIHDLSEKFSQLLLNKYNISKKIMDDGHSTIYIGNLKMDFSSNFNAPNIGSILNKIGINNPTDLQKEIFSRDFTCNALLLSLDLKTLLDPTEHGFEDIKNKIIKTCLDPKITLTSNKNRVVRAIYLACKLDFNIDKSIIDLVALNPDLIKISSNKSLVEKLNSAFTFDSDKASFLLKQMNLWNHVPITEKMYPYYIKREQRLNSGK